ncbi:MAG: hypothetical protein CML66_11965 [Rhodobacteraceae bacterium]|nr:hypothetical protein [Paracoccaceae bacterium]MAY45630.1 hypothetical protein [Paracoccaceae bacterium]
MMDTDKGLLGWRTRIVVPFFDAEFHRQTCGPTQEPLHDFRTTGWKAGRDASAEFSTSGNLEDRPDVAKAGLNPLVHHAIFRRFRPRDVLAEAHEQSEEGWVPWLGSKGIDNGRSGRTAVSSFNTPMRDVCEPHADGDDFAPYPPDIAQSLDVMRDLAGQLRIAPEKGPVHADACRPRHPPYHQAGDRGFAGRGIRSMVPGDGRRGLHPGGRRPRAPQ